MFDDPNQMKPIDLGRDDPGVTSVGKPYQGDTIPTGMGGQPEPKPADVPDMRTYGQDQQPENDPFSVYSLLNQVPAHIQGTADQIASFSRNAITANDIINSAKEGNSTIDTVTERSNAVTQQKADEAAMNAQSIQSAQAQQKWQEAQKAFEEHLHQQPNIPDVVKAELSDPEKLFTLLAGVIGGSFPAGSNFLSSALQGANQRAQVENQHNQQNYADQFKQWKEQGDQLNDITNQARYGAQLEDQNTRALQSQVEQNQRERARLEQKSDFDKQKDLDTRTKSTENEMTKMFNSKGVWTFEDEQWLAERSKQIAELHNLNPHDVYRYLSKYNIGDKTAKQGNADRNFSFKVDKNAFDQEFKNKTFDQRQSMFDTKFQEQVKEFEKTFGRNLTNDEWRQAYQKGMMEISKQNADTSAGRATESSRHNTVTENQGQQRINQSHTTNADGTPRTEKQMTAHIKTFGDQFKEAMGKGSRYEQFGPGSISKSLHPSGRALDLYADDFNKAMQYAQSHQVPYIIFNRKSYTLDPTDGKYIVKKYTGPNPHTDHIHIDWKGGEPTEAEANNIQSNTRDTYQQIIKDAGKPSVKVDANTKMKPGGNPPVKPSPTKQATKPTVQVPTKTKTATTKAGTEFRRG